MARDVVDFELVMGGPNLASQMLHDTAVLQGDGLKAIVYGLPLLSLPVFSLKEACEMETQVREVSNQTEGTCRSLSVRR